MRVTRLMTDIGTMEIQVLTVMLNDEFTEEDLRALLRIRASCPGMLMVICNAEKIIGLRQVSYALYLALRNKVQGVSRARDSSIEAISLMMGETQLARGLSEANPVGRRYVVIGIASLNSCIEDVMTTLVGVLEARHSCYGLAIGAGIIRTYNGPWIDEQEALEEIIEANLEWVGRGSG